MKRWRSLRMPDPQAPDYWEQSAVWWDNWAHNAGLSLILWPSVACLVLVALMLWSLR